jgi:hypothetical protein
VARGIDCLDEGRPSWVEDLVTGQPSVLAYASSQAHSELSSTISGTILWSAVKNKDRAGQLIKPPSVLRTVRVPAQSGGVRGTIMTRTPRPKATEAASTHVGTMRFSGMTGSSVCAEE